MATQDLKHALLRLAELKNNPETSDGLRQYVTDALARDPVDVLNELAVLGEIANPAGSPAKKRAKQIRNRER